ncbi:hypothetical protein Pfo_026881 [Paulownia fortunei]|nr:hypothetical protein Pfo_026881 [Paulownia fortunei]
MQRDLKNPSLPFPNVAKKKRHFNQAEMSRDNWERLVAAVLRREQLWQLFHDHSRTPSITSIASSDDLTANFSEQLLNNIFKPISISPPPPLPLTNPSVSQVGDNATGPFTRKLFSAPATVLAWYRRRKPNLVDIPETHMRQIRKYSLHELKVATDNFSNKNVLAHKYHKVYKGRLADGSLVAVKRLHQVTELQFQIEIEMICKVLHPNLVCLLGLCSTPKEQLLVYPLMVNGSVASCLRGGIQKKSLGGLSFIRRQIGGLESQPPLGWPIRKRIAVGTARGLAYLHYECDRKIIHRNVKAANILLDEDFEAVIGDFELVVLMDHNVTHVTTTVTGTIGHIAPEYLSSGICSEKTDVFGYGVFLLELITGQRAFDLARLANGEDAILLDWVKRTLKEKNWKMIVDPESGGNHMEEVVEQLMQIALLCTQSMPEGRPKMSEIVKMLQVGDGLAERWEESCKKEMFGQEIKKQIYSSSNMSNDNTSIIPPDELSGPR